MGVIRRAGAAMARAALRRDERLHHLVLGIVHVLGSHLELRHEARLRPRVHAHTILVDELPYELLIDSP